MGSYSRTLEAGGSFTITVTTGANSTENKLVLTDIAFTPATQAFTVTVEYPTAKGSVTSSVESTSVDAEGTTTMTIPEVTAADGVTLTATSDTFLCWVDKDNKLLTKDTTYVVKPSADTTVKALMSSDIAHFLVNGNLVYSDLNEAVDMVGTASNKTIVLMNNGTLPAGEYTIPSGVTLLIPYNDANTLCTTAPSTQEDLKYSTATVYRKLTMADGAKIIVNGALSLSALTTSSGGQSSPVGNCSFIDMKSGSNITVNNGGKLYAWGYITGKGSVTVENGGTVYECFQVMDWRGGDNTSGMIDNSYRVFPMSQYYIQNVEVPMTLKAGAIEKGYMSVQITLVGISGAAVPFIGSDGMFNIDSGYIVKDYNESTGRLEIDTYGDVSVKSLSISMQLSLLGTKTINSSKYVLPINANGGTVQTADIKDLDPADLWITVNADQTFDVTYDDPTAPKAADITVYAYVPEDWAEPCLWAWSHPDGTNAFVSWPGEAFEKGEDGVYKITVPGWINSVIVNANGGTVQTADLRVEAGKDLYVTVVSAEEATVAYEAAE